MLNHLSPKVARDFSHTIRHPLGILGNFELDEVEIERFNFQVKLELIRNQNRRLPGAGFINDLDNFNGEF